ncbi:hypothetical protein RFI_36654, partial [Reticulomyxa filosa]
AEKKENGLASANETESRDTRNTGFCIGSKSKESKFETRYRKSLTDNSTCKQMHDLSNELSADQKIHSKLNPLRQLSSLQKEKIVYVVEETKYKIYFQISLISRKIIILKSDLPFIFHPSSFFIEQLKEKF